MRNRQLGNKGAVSYLMLLFLALSIASLPACQKAKYGRRGVSDLARNKNTGGQSQPAPHNTQTQPQGSQGQQGSHPPQRPQTQDHKDLFNVDEIEHSTTDNRPPQRPVQQERQTYVVPDPDSGENIVEWVEGPSHASGESVLNSCGGADEDCAPKKSPPVVQRPVEPPIQDEIPKIEEPIQEEVQQPAPEAPVQQQPVQQEPVQQEEVIVEKSLEFKHKQFEAMKDLEIIVVADSTSQSQQVRDELAQQFLNFLNQIPSDISLNVAVIPAVQNSDMAGKPLSVTKSDPHVLRFGGEFQSDGIFHSKEQIAEYMRMKLADETYTAASGHAGLYSLNEAIQNELRKRSDKSKHSSILDNLLLQTTATLIVFLDKGEDVCFNGTSCTGFSPDSIIAGLRQLKNNSPFRVTSLTSSRATQELIAAAGKDGIQLASTDMGSALKKLVRESQDMLYMGHVYNKFRLWGADVEVVSVQVDDEILAPEYYSLSPDPNNQGQAFILTLSKAGVPHSDVIVRFRDRAATKPLN